MTKPDYENDPDYQKLKAEFDRVAQKADAAKAREKAKLDRWKARKSEAIRKHDAKRKIIGGGFLYKLAADGDENARAVMRKLQTHLNSETARASDKKAFEGWNWPDTKTETAPADPDQKAEIDYEAMVREAEQQFQKMKESGKRFAP